MASVASFNLDTTIGVFQIGVLVSYVLFGVMMTQMYIYYTRFPDDSLKLKVLVAFVWVGEIAHALCVGHTLYVWTISDYAHPPDPLLAAVPKSLDIAILFTGGIILCVQGFFAFRIYRFSRKISIPIIISILAFLRLVGAALLFAESWQMKSLDGYIAQWQWLANCGWSVSAANDLTITVTLVFLLYRERDNVHKRTAAMVDKLILWTLETGFLTSVGAIVELACFIAMDKNFIWLAFYVVSPRLYSNSLLASLNSRVTLREMNQVSMPISLPNLTPAPSDSAKSTQCTQDKSCI
ncbi:hypothetical protein B0H14DRAFT_912656 [Mycena olivaceomarginata]|nr:hypothetical protein B0H14DRAFT_912656 [Mycena olivaceomarginata]